MLDIHFIRENKDLITEAARKKHIDFNVDELISADDKRKKFQSEVDELRAHQNNVSAEISQMTDDQSRQEKISESKKTKETLQQKEEELKQVMETWKQLMIRVPNVPDISVPEGESDSDNVEVKEVGEKPNFSFEPKDHIEIMTSLNMADFERGTKVHGFRGYYLIGDGALLSWAIWNYARDFFLKKGFTPMLPPTIVKKENLYGTGHLPSEAEDVFHTQDEDYLIGTSEIPAMGFYSGEVLEKSQLPVKFLAFSPCYRREAGSHGKDVKGLIRVHEFFKLEQVILCEASHEESVKWHEWVTENTEAFMQSLGIPYRVVINCGGDLGQGQVKKYDIEAWVPKENKYRETHSSSYFHDFQTRRFNIRYRDDDGKLRYLHSLNNTAIASPRILVSLIENFQQDDGSIVIPEPLRPYLNGRDKIASS